MEWLIEQTADLNRGGNAVKEFAQPRILAYSGDSEAHRWRVNVTESGTPVDMSAATITAYIKLSNGSTVPIIGAGTADGAAEVVFLDDVYALGGQIQCVMRATIGTKIVTIGAFTAVVMQSVTDGPIIDPTGIIPSVEELVSLLEDVEGVYASSVRFDITQSLTAEQKARAVSNIGLSEKSTADDLAYILGT